MTFTPSTRYCPVRHSPSFATPQLSPTHVCLRGMLLPQTRSEAGKFCILKIESINLVNTFRCKFKKGDENEISVLQAQPTQLCIIWMNFIGGHGWYTGYYLPSQTRKRIYPTNTSINLHPWLSKQMPSVHVWGCASRGVFVSPELSLVTDYRMWSLILYVVCR